MNNLKRLFGSGLTGLIISLALLFLAHYLRSLLYIPRIFSYHETIRITIFILLTISGIVVIIWSIISLNPKLRGKTLITTGAFKYLRHPLYAAFLSFFNFGFAIFLNNWIFIFWAILLHPVWHLIISGEEKMLKDIFPIDYEEYCKSTGRFFPKLIKKKE